MSRDLKVARQQVDKVSMSKDHELIRSCDNYVSRSAGQKSRMLHSKKVTWSRGCHVCVRLKYLRYLIKQLRRMTTLRLGLMTTKQLRRMTTSQIFCQKKHWSIQPLRKMERNLQSIDINDRHLTMNKNEKAKIFGVTPFQLSCWPLNGISELQKPKYKPITKHDLT